MAPLFQRAGWSYADTLREVRKAAQGAFLKQQRDPRGAITAPAGGIEILSAAQLEDRPPPEWQIEGVLPEHAFVNIYGDSASFKSFVALDMALSIATGTPWHDRPVKQGVVLYVLGEGQGSFATRMRAWMAHNGVEAPPEHFHAVLTPIGMGDAPAITALRDAIQARRLAPAVIVIDTLARNFGSGDPDKTKDMGMFVAGVDALRHEFKAAAWVIHHSGKDKTKGARNSNALRAAVDVEIETDRFDQDMAVTLTCKKQKDAEEFQPMRLDLRAVEVVNKTTGEVASSLAVATAGISTLPRPKPGDGEQGPSRLGRNERLVLSKLDDGAQTFATLLARTGFDNGTLGRCLRSLTSKGLVAEQNGLYLWRNATSGVSEND
jgi:hypothetical protein